MSLSCRKVEAMLAGDPSAGSKGRLSAHLAGCAGCRTAAAGLERVRSGFAALQDEAHEGRLAPHVRARILREASGQRAHRPAIPMVLGGLLGVRMLPAVAVAGLVFVIVGIGHLRVPSQAPTPSATQSSVARASNPLNLRLVETDAGIVLEWNGGEDRTYTVRKATDARRLKDAPGVPVKGNRFVAGYPTDSQVVFYKVE